MEGWSLVEQEAAVVLSAPVAAEAPNAGYCNHDMTYYNRYNDTQCFS